MEVETSWNVDQKSIQIQPNDFDSICAVSPDGKTICKVENSKVTFINSSETQSVKVAVQSYDAITCIETVYANPWIVAVGTHSGTIHFLNNKKEIGKYQPLNLRITKIRVSKYNGGQFTAPSSSLVIQCPPDLVIAPLEAFTDLFENGEMNEIQFNKWHIEKNYFDAILVDSKFSTPIMNGLHDFPAIYAITQDPFFSVHSVSKAAIPRASEVLKKAVTGVFRWIVGTTDQQEEEYPKAPEQWSLKDDGRVSKSIEADPTGRWIALCDAQGRVLLIDSVFGHIVKVFKGLRDAQVAWAESSSHLSVLIIYAPYRKMIIACTTPNGEIIDAVRAAPGGKLVQLHTPKFCVGYFDANKNFSVFNVKYENKSTSSPNKYSMISFPKYLLADESEAAVKSHTCKNKEDFIAAAKLAKNAEESLAVIRSMVSMMVSDDIILDVVKVLKENNLKKDITTSNSSETLNESVDVKTDEMGYLRNHVFGSFDDELAGVYWESRDSSMTQTEPDLLFLSHCRLIDFWQNMPQRKARKVNFQKVPKSRITDYLQERVPSFSDILPQKPPPLSKFIVNPISHYSFFFDFMNEETELQDIYRAFSISKCDKDVFVETLIKWTLSCSPSQLILSQNVLTQFFKLSKVDDIYYKFNDQLKGDTVNEAVFGIIAEV